MLSYALLDFGREAEELLVEGDVEFVGATLSRRRGRLKLVGLRYAGASAVVWRMDVVDINRICLEMENSVGLRHLCIKSSARKARVEEAMVLRPSKVLLAQSSGRCQRSSLFHMLQP